MVATIAPVSTILATILTPIDTNICYLITRVVVRVSLLAPLTPEGIVISAYFTISAVAINISTVIRVVVFLAPITIDTTISAYLIAITITL
jgi:hypothetical protein